MTNTNLIREYVLHVYNLNNYGDHVYLYYYVEKLKEREENSDFSSMFVSTKMCLSLNDMYIWLNKKRDEKLNILINI